MKGALVFVEQQDMAASTFVFAFLYIFSLLWVPGHQNLINTEHDSNGVPLAHLMARQIFAKRTRQAILEVDTQELKDMIETEAYVAVLYQDYTKVRSSTYYFDIFYMHFTVFILTQF